MHFTAPFIKPRRNQRKRTCGKSYSNLLVTNVTENKPVDVKKAKKFSVPTV
jgi:hypothetical protein